MSTIHVDVVSAEESIFEGEVEFISLPGEQGELGIYPRHTPLITRIKPGTVRMNIPGQAQQELIFVNGGVLEIQPHGVTVLADTALRGKDLDEAKASEAKRLAQETLANQHGDVDYAKAQAELDSAIAQLQTIKRLKQIK